MSVITHNINWNACRAAGINPVTYTCDLYSERPTGSEGDRCYCNETGLIYIKGAVSWSTETSGGQGPQGEPGEDGADGAQGIQGIQGIQGVPGTNSTDVNVRTSADRTTTSTALGNITDLSFAIGAGETWSFEANLAAGCSGTGGSQFAVTVPAGATLRVQFFGNVASATAFSQSVVTTSDAVSVTMLTANAQGRLVRISGVVVNAGNAGSVNMRFKSVTNGQTTTVNANSYLVARRH